jgi:predicted RNase H-like HicB family nuclease
MFSEYNIPMTIAIENKVGLPHIQSMPKREYTAVYKKEGRWIIAWIEEVPGAHTQGRTMEEAKENLREALTLILEENKKMASSKTHL